MADSSEPVASGVLTIRFPISVANGLPATKLFCARWAFKTDQDLGISSVESRGPVQCALFAVAFGPPVNDREAQGRVRCEVLAMIPMQNVLGWAACDKAPPSAKGIVPQESRA